MTSSVSVIIPTFNGSAFLREALDSVFAQTVRPEEVIVVDDASTDGTAELAESIATTAPVPVKVIRLSENSGGPARPLNVGIAAAQGEFIAILNEDDVFEPQKLEKQVAVLSRELGMTFVFSFCGKYEDPQQLLQPSETIEELTKSSQCRGDYAYLEGRAALRLLIERWNFVIGFPAFLFRRRDWVKKGGFDQTLQIACDYDYICWLCTQGSVGVISHAQYYHRTHADNLSAGWGQASREIVSVQVKLYQQEGWLQSDRAISRIIRSRHLNQYLDVAHRLMNSGQYVQALRQQILALRHCDYRHQTLLAMLKLLPHWLGYRGRMAQS